MPSKLSTQHTCPSLTRLLVVATVAIGAAISIVNPAAGLEAIARAAHTLNGTATSRLRLVRAEGSQLTEEGPVSGALIGSARAQLHTGSVFTSSFTIHTHTGTITGHGQATPHGSGRYQSFSGFFLATGGTGRYAHIRGRAGLYGVFDRRTDSVVIQTTGNLKY